MKLRSVRRNSGARLVVSVTAAVIMSAFVGQAKNDEADRGSEAYTIGLFGDMPYNALGRSQYPALLADINRRHVAFSVFNGDLKSGGDGPCADSLYYTAIENFNTLERPLVWVPGDNDWTDCWGRYGPGTLPYPDPLERLDFQRRVVHVDRSEPGPKDTHADPPIERRWLLRLVFGKCPLEVRARRLIGLNVQGSNDNYPYAGVDGETRSASEIERQRAEERARKAASLQWLHEGFVREQGSGQGDHGGATGRPELQQRATPRRHPFVGRLPRLRDALANEAPAFAGQVALVHGDSHYFKIDKPLNGPDGGVLANFTRVETFGARNTHWVSATSTRRTRTCSNSIRESSLRMRTRPKKGDEVDSIQTPEVSYAKSENERESRGRRSRPHTASGDGDDR